VKYSGEQMALGVTTSSGCIATIIPPSISLIFFGIATETSIGQLFMAGFFPGLVMVVIVGAYVIVATKSRPVFDEQIAKEGFLKLLPVLLMPVVVLGGIYGGFFTPVEAGAVSAVYALVAAVFYRELTWEKLKFCLSIFVVQGVLEQPFEKISRAVVPFIVVYLVSLMIITFVPAISLWLPSMLR
jgi:C4-dicarboxylate transporter DctM subunit